MITTHTKKKIIFLLDTKYNKPIHEIIIKDQNENILKTNDFS